MRKEVNLRKRIQTRSKITLTVKCNSFTVIPRESTNTIINLHGISMKNGNELSSLKHLFKEIL